MRTKYFIDRGDFRNQYGLCYTTDGFEPKGMERITRKEAETYAREEARRRVNDPSSSGYADQYIYPYSNDGTPMLSAYDGVDFGTLLDWARYGYRGWRLDGRILRYDPNWLQKRKSEGYYVWFEKFL